MQPACVNACESSFLKDSLSVIGLSSQRTWIREARAIFDGLSMNLAKLV